MKIIHLDKLKLLSICLSFLFILTKGYTSEASQTEDDDIKKDRPISKASNLRDPKLNADNTEVQTTSWLPIKITLNIEDHYIGGRELHSSISRKQPNFPIYR